MLECAKCGADRSGVASGEPCPKCGEASVGAQAAVVAGADPPAAAPGAGGEGRPPVAAAASSADWVDDTSPDSEERLKPADLEAWRSARTGGREVPPVRQPPPGLRPSRRGSTGRGVSVAQVPPPPPMDFTPAPELVSELTPPPEVVAEPAPPMARVATPRPAPMVPAAAPPPAAPHPFTPPRASTPPPSFSTPLPGSMPPPASDIPDLTDEVDPQPVPAVWKQAHPSARKWAERRQGGAAVSSKRAPSLPRVVLGILIAGLGAWLVLSFLPDRKPLTAAERARVEKQAGIDADAWRFGPTGYMAARGGAALYITIGILVALRGLLYRRRIETPCRRCGRTVLAERSGLSLRCDTGQHAAGVNASALGLAIAFAALSLALAVLFAGASLGG